MAQDANKKENLIESRMLYGANDKAQILAWAKEAYSVRYETLPLADSESLFVLLANPRASSSNYEEIFVFVGSDWVKDCKENCGWRLLTYRTTYCENISVRLDKTKMRLSFTSNSGKELESISIDTIDLVDVLPHPVR